MIAKQTLKASVGNYVSGYINELDGFLCLNITGDLYGHIGFKEACRYVNGDTFFFNLFDQTDELQAINVFMRGRYKAESNSMSVDMGRFDGRARIMIEDRIDRMLNSHIKSELSFDLTGLTDDQLSELPCSINVW